MAVLVLRLLDPIQPVVVPAAIDEVIVTVSVRVMNQNGNARVAVQFPIRMPDPAACAAILGRFKPAFGTNDVAAAVTIDVAKANPVASDLDRQVVLDELRLAASHDFVPGGEVGAVRQDVELAVAVDV